jgi:hypothetical protein
MENPASSDISRHLRTHQGEKKTLVPVIKIKPPLVDHDSRSCSKIPLSFILNNSMAVGSENKLFPFARRAALGRKAIRQEHVCQSQEEFSDYLHSRIRTLSSELPCSNVEDVGSSAGKDFQAHRSKKRSYWDIVLKPSVSYNGVILPPIATAEEDIGRRTAEQPSPVRLQEPTKKIFDCGDCSATFDYQSHLRTRESHTAKIFTFRFFVMPRLKLTPFVLYI